MQTPKPYVYRLTHKESGRFYIGYRMANVTARYQWSEDLGIRYFSSCGDISRANFHEYDAELIAEFDDGVTAYRHEQELIISSLFSPLLINKGAMDKTKRPLVLLGHSEETKQKISKAHMGMKSTPEQIRKMADAKRGVKYRVPRSAEYRKSVGDRSRGRVYSDTAIQNFKEGQRRRFERPEEREKVAKRNRIRGLMEEHKSRRVVVIDPSGKASLYKGARQFSEDFEIKARISYHLFSKFNGKVVNRGRMKGHYLWMDGHGVTPSEAVRSVLDRP